MRRAPTDMTREPSVHDRGAALLTVLLLVAIMAVVTTLALDRLLIATRIAQNSAATDRAAALAQAGEQFAALRIAGIVEANVGRVTNQTGWIGTPTTLPVADGVVVARVSDGGNCFNLNGLVIAESDGQFVARPESIEQFASLMRLLGVDVVRAVAIARASADWIDSDTNPLGGGAEDESYAGDAIPYRTGNGLMVDASEWRVVAGVTPDVYQRVRPWLCAIPEAVPSPININTLLPQQAILLSMLAPDRLPVARARQVLALRPRDGYGSLVTFWSQPNLVNLEIPSEARNQTKLTTTWFKVDMDVRIGDNVLQQSSLFDARSKPVRLVSRARGERE